MDKISFMKEAIKQAKIACKEDEVPVGAVAVLNGKIIARARNRKEKKLDATAHAEVELIKKVSKKLNNWWLEDVDIYVTLEPCPMCTGAMINARIRSLYYGASDTKSGCCGSLYDLTGDKKFNHDINVEGGILKEECAGLLTAFFKNKRKGDKQ